MPAKYIVYIVCLCLHAHASVFVCMCVCERVCTKAQVCVLKKKCKSIKHVNVYREELNNYMENIFARNSLDRQSPLSH